MGKVAGILYWGSAFHQTYEVADSVASLGMTKEVNPVMIRPNPVVKLG